MYGYAMNIDAAASMVNRERGRYKRLVLYIQIEEINHSILSILAHM